MAVSFSFSDKVAIVTGAGGGLGRAHALALAERGAKILVNDVGGAVSGGGTDERPAAEVVAEVERRGGEAMVSRADVTDVRDVEGMVAQTIQRWGRVDILINNAGILRDRSFAKMDVEDFRRVLDVHLMGAVHCTKAVWPHMVQQGFGRVLMTTSGSGIYGNFGQTNYGAAKSGVVGLMNVLAIEGARKGIHVNTLAPTAATRMTEDLIDPDTTAVLEPESIAPGALFLVSDAAPNKTILAAGAGVFAVARMEESAGVYLPEEARLPETVADRWSEISDMSASVVTGSAFDQTARYVELAGAHSEPTGVPQ
ncbi:MULTISPECIES: SDR family NAD(P)-dependent oxidoreductase [Prauserella salsuginis group]|uniref:SDR family NAD(P)-dependent oxidoreductase n=1 Tax=Prauserella salsuginis TaxID=387889 RepID=A0ABW6G0C0_9PSEU|nr:MULTISPECIES: SDR family NAD(P)-dependent oxidoreductase [Prauserella salsuginis group]MCR3721267.1 NAD(P)-dependent dehydrogenase, short-chain alcohol dehydrogenase family [Prauserella flava]MCR3734653.1 NAD(P)-dependent dehydrogenase, short-chain alcohol dehydrogenase family [Prauserella salsuginis]